MSGKDADRSQTLPPGDEPGGDFGDWKIVAHRCRRCGQTSIRHRVWESSDGAHEDDQYWCQTCGHRWWLEGIDA